VHGGGENIMAFTPTLFVTILASRDPETGLIQPPYTPAQVLHVMKTGNDTTGNGTFANPYLTVNKAMSVLQPSGEIHVYSGRYFEFTVSNPYVPQQVLLHPVYAATAPLINGTIFHPCVLKAAAGHEGSVIIDGGGVYAGLVTQAKSYWSLYGLRFENCMNAAIASIGGATLNLDPSTLSVSWTIENCCAKSVDSYSDKGNVSGIAPWGSKDWVIRNSKISDIRRNAAEDSNLVASIQTYGAINLIVENCYFEDADFGYFAKDHLLDPDTGLPYKGATIRNSHFKTRSRPFYLGVRGGATAHCGQTIAQNCIFHHTGFDGGGGVVVAEMGAGLEQSTQLIIENCVLRADDPTTKLTVVSGFADFKNRNNIHIGGLNQIQINDQGWTTLLTESNRNAYTAFEGRLNAFGAGDASYNFTNWKALVAGAKSTLGYSNPDSLSVISTSAAMFIDMDAGDYRFKAGSPTIGLAGGGLNSGPYQTNLEHIGLLPTYSAGA